MADEDTVAITVDGKVIDAARGSTLLNGLINAGVLVATACGGQGTCHLCRVKISSPGLAPANEVERRALGNVDRAAGLRLACQVSVEVPLAVSVPPARPRRRGRRA